VSADSPIESDLMRTSTVCKLLEVGVTKLKAMRKTGHFPLKAKRFGRSLRWSRDEYMAWKAAGFPPSSRWGFIREQLKVAG
jgi:predicted DNA-binding transcriptional regulator AlpA